MVNRPTFQSTRRSSASDRLIPPDRAQTTHCSAQGSLLVGSLCSASGLGELIVRWLSNLTPHPRESESVIETTNHYYICMLCVCVCVCVYYATKRATAPASPVLGFISLNKGVGLRVCIFRPAVQVLQLLAQIEARRMSCSLISCL